MGDVTIYSIGLSTTVAEVRGPQQQAAPLRATAPGTYALSPLPGVADTPTVERLREGNIDLGGLVRHSWSFVSSEPAFDSVVSATGGLYQSSFRYGSIENAMNRIADELHSQYTLIFSPEVKKEYRNGFHGIRVQVVGQPDIFHARFRPGYYANLPK
jgi:hypothetical protein